MRKRSVLVVALVGAILLVPAVVYGSHQFTDVSDSHLFHNDIDWLADQGITRGCGGSQFCPDENVTRGQMAAFMKRFHDTFIVNGSSSGSPSIALGTAARGSSETPSTGDGVVDGLSMNLNIPEFGILVVDGSVDMSNTVESDAFGCGINTGGSIDLAQDDSWRVVDLTLSASDTCSTTTAFLVSAGNQTVRVVISGALASTEAYGGTITAILYTSDVAGLLGEGLDDSQTTGPELSDTPKGGG